MWDKKEAEAFIKEAENYGSVMGLSSIRNLMEELGQVQDGLNTIHVAGTNGKGSVCAMLYSIFQQAGFKTGVYSSPQVFCYEEKFRINGKNISQEELTDCLWEIREACLRLTHGGKPHPTLFEIETALAFLWFYKSGCKIVVLETGLGGAEDATNIIRKPLCSVFTSISMDHMKILGNSLGEIAEVKAGIIKEGCPAVTVCQEPEALVKLEEAARRMNTELTVADASGASNVRYEGGRLVFDWENRTNIRLPLLGACQLENAVCAITAIHRLNGCGFCISDQALETGLELAVWPGRFEVISEHPLVVLDGAHNEDAAKKLKKTLEMGFTNRKIIYIIGVLGDKEHEKMLHHLLPLAHRVYTVTPPNPRALSGEYLLGEVKKHIKEASYIQDIGAAVGRALSEAWQEDAMVLAFGSLSYLGEVKREVEHRIQLDMAAMGEK